MPTPPDKPVSDEIAEARKRTDKSLGRNETRGMVDQDRVEEEREATDARIAALEAALKLAQVHVERRHEYFKRKIAADIGRDDNAARKDHEELLALTLDDLSKIRSTLSRRST